MLFYHTKYRPFVFDRAHGRCEACGWDIKKHVAQVGRWLAACYPRVGSNAVSDYPRQPWWSCKVPLFVAPPDRTLERRRDALKRVERVLRKIGGTLVGPTYGLWQVDHIVPLVEGGQHSLDNMRLLCTRCHKAETAALASRRKKPSSKSKPSRSRGHETRAE